jgi:hypothetical protein
MCLETTDVDPKLGVLIKLVSALKGVCKHCFDAPHNWRVAQASEQQVEPFLPCYFAFWAQISQFEGNALGAVKWLDVANAESSLQP